MYYLMCVPIEGPLLSEVPVSSGRILGENGTQKNTWKPHGLGHHSFFSPQCPCSAVIYKTNHCFSSSDFICKLNHITISPHLASKKGQSSPAKIEKSIFNSDMKGANEHFSVSLKRPNWYFKM